MKDDKFVPGPISPQIDAANDVIFPKELLSKPMAHMTTDELLRFMDMLLSPRAWALSESETDKPENKHFMEEACDSWKDLDLGNNGEPASAEDCDVDSLLEDE